VSLAQPYKFIRNEISVPLRSYVNGDASVDKGGNDEIYMWQDRRFRRRGTYVIRVM